MKKLSLFLLLPLFLCAEHRDNSYNLEVVQNPLKTQTPNSKYFYGRSGATGFYAEGNTFIAPSIGFGMRGKNHQLGYDLSLNGGIGTLDGLHDISPPFITAKGQLFYYTSKSPTSNFFGLSQEGIWVFSENIGLPYSELIGGREWKRKSEKSSFFYIGLNPLPTLLAQKMPLVSVNYGLGF